MKVVVLPAVAAALAAAAAAAGEVGGVTTVAPSGTGMELAPRMYCSTDSYVHSAGQPCTTMGTPHTAAGLSYGSKVHSTGQQPPL